MNCPTCNNDLVFITHKVLQEIKKKLKPAFKTPSLKDTKVKSDRYAICPQCDAYALGIDLEEGFPFEDKVGRTLNIQTWNEEKEIE